MSAATPSPPSSATPEKLLFQSVLLLALLDATSKSTAKQPTEDREKARSWLEGGNRDFRHVCFLAGFDPDHVQEAYRSGRVDRANLKGGTATHRAGRPALAGRGL